MTKINDASRRFTEAVSFYLANLEATGASALTVDNYSQTLESFYRFWAGEDEAPTFAAVQAWRDELLSRGLKASTVKKYLTRLNSFFAAVTDISLQERRFFDVNPVSKRLMPDTRKSEARPYDVILTDEQAMKLWRVDPSVYDGRSGGNYYRNYAIIVLLLSTEIRTSELLALTLPDLDFENAELYVEHGKGDKFRVVDFPEIAQTAVRLYLESPVSRPADLSGNALLFGGLTRQGLAKLVEQHVYRVTGVHGVTGHDLRHVGARLDLNNGMPIEELQAKLGHSNVSTTQIYSGRLTARRSRMMAREAFAERDKQAQRNAERLGEIA